MRVIAGSAKGTRLARVPTGTRPLADRAREGLFSSLGPSIPGARVLDLFAGTGSVGIEALSRGARAALFVDTSAAAVAAIEENLRRTNLRESAEVRRGEALRVVSSRPGVFDLVFVDPPYRLGKDGVDEVLAALARGGVAAAGGSVAVTRGVRSASPSVPVDWKQRRRLGYGDAVIYVFETP